MNQYAKCETIDITREYQQKTSINGNPSVKKTIPHDWNPLAYQIDQIYVKCRVCKVTTDYVPHAIELGRVKAPFDKTGCTGKN